MDYEAVRAQVLALLQQEQRLSYRVLKRQLQLDDETLEDLKEDLIYAKKLAVDEDGRVLVWIGAPGTSPGQQGAAAPEGAGARSSPVTRSRSSPARWKARGRAVTGSSSRTRRAPVRRSGSGSRASDESTRSTPGVRSS